MRVAPWRQWKRAVVNGNLVIPTMQKSLQMMREVNDRMSEVKVLCADDEC